MPENVPLSGVPSTVPKTLPTKELWGIAPGVLYPLLPVT